MTDPHAPSRSSRPHSRIPLVTMPVSPPGPPARSAAASPGARVAGALEGAGLSGGGGRGLGPDGKPREAVPDGVRGHPAAAWGGRARAAMAVEAGPGPGAGGRRCSGPWGLAYLGVRAAGRAGVGGGTRDRAPGGGCRKPKTQNRKQKPHAARPRWTDSAPAAAAARGRRRRQGCAGRGGASKGGAGRGPRRPPLPPAIGRFPDPRPRRAPPRTSPRSLTSGL